MRIIYLLDKIYRVRYNPYFTYTLRLGMRHITETLTRNTGRNSQRIYRKIKQLREMAPLLEQVLPTHLVPYVHLANLREDRTLVLRADNAAIATRLRCLQHTLVDLFNTVNPQSVCKVHIICPPNPSTCFSTLA